jgi:hypothetical protein
VACTHCRSEESVTKYIRKRVTSRLSIVKPTKAARPVATSSNPSRLRMLAVMTASGSMLKRYVMSKVRPSTTIRSNTSQIYYHLHGILHFYRAHL